MASPTARSLLLLRRSGYLAKPVEHWNAHAGIRQDLFGFADVLAVSDKREPRFLLVQSTSSPNVAARVSKMKQAPALRVWLRAGGAAEVHGWFKAPAGLWQCRRVEVKLADVEDGDLVTIQPRRRRRAARAVQPLLWEAS